MARCFASNIHFGPNCWEWIGGRDNQGYGNYQHPDLHKGVKAHRYAYEMVNGPIPEGMIVCHRCDNPSCVRHDHLFLGTDEDNSKDMTSKGRHANQQKTHCNAGHPYDEKNTYSWNGHRGCRECRRNQLRASMDRRSNASN